MIDQDALGKEFSNEPLTDEEYSILSYFDYDWVDECMLNAEGEVYLSDGVWAKQYGYCYDLDILSAADARAMIDLNKEKIEWVNECESQSADVDK